MPEITFDSPLNGHALRSSVKKLTQQLQAGQLTLRTAKQTGMKKIIKDYLFHPYPEFFFQLEGTSEFNFPEEQIRLQPGDYLLVPPGLPHMEKMIKQDNKFLTMVITCTKTATCLHFSAQELVDSHPTITYVERFNQTAPSPTEALCNNIIESSTLPINVQTLVNTGYTLSLLGLCLHYLSTPAPLTTENRTVRQIRNLVMSRYQETSLSVKGLAKQSGYTADYLSYLFHKETKQTLSSYITKVRLKKAKELLMESNYTISEISWLCGFNTASYFSKVFMKANGQSPKEYRQE